MQYRVFTEAAYGRIHRSVAEQWATAVSYRRRKWRRGDVTGRAFFMRTETTPTVRTVVWVPETHGLLDWEIAELIDQTAFDALSFSPNAALDGRQMVVGLYNATGESGDKPNSTWLAARTLEGFSWFYSEDIRALSLSAAEARIQIYEDAFWSTGVLLDLSSLANFEADLTEYGAMLDSHNPYAFFIRGPHEGTEDSPYAGRENYRLAAEAGSEYLPFHLNTDNLYEDPNSVAYPLRITKDGVFPATLEPHWLHSTASGGGTGLSTEAVAAATRRNDYPYLVSNAQRGVWMAHVNVQTNQDAAALATHLAYLEKLGYTHLLVRCIAIGDNGTQAAIGGTTAADGVSAFFTAKGL